MAPVNHRLHLFTLVGQDHGVDGKPHDFIGRITLELAHRGADIDEALIVHIVNPGVVIHILGQRPVLLLAAQQGALDASSLFDVTFERRLGGAQFMLQALAVQVDHCKRDHQNRDDLERDVSGLKRGVRVQAVDGCQK